MENINETAGRNFSLWNDTLLTKDPKKVAELYDENATFLPTLSDEFKKGKSGAEAYFHHFLEKNPTGVIRQHEVQVITPDCYLDSGMYDFEVGPDNDRQTAEARFSFVWERKNKGEWKIIHHHSSVKPKN